MSRPQRVLLVSSSGGVLLDLLGLRPWWQRHETTWVAVRAADTTIVLAGLAVTWQRAPNGWPQLPPAIWRALRLLRRDRPDLIVSAGSGLAVPYFLAARLRGIPTVWLETLTQTEPPVGAARLCTRLARTVLVQRPMRVYAHKRAVLVGELL